MIPILPEQIQEYLQKHVHTRSEIFHEMEMYAHEREFPIVGPLVGQLLALITRISRANNIIEIGSGFGYSALWFAAGLTGKGTIVCTEFSEDNIAKGKEYVQKMNMSSKIKFVRGDGLEILERRKENFDIIFNDAQKETYPSLFDVARRKLRRNGMLISDNVLWSGRVATEDGDEKTGAVKKYNELIFNSPDFHSTIIPLRDGVSISVRK